MKKYILPSIVCFLIAVGAATAQQAQWLWWGTNSNTAVPVSASNPLPVTGAGGGGTVNSGTTGQIAQYPSNGTTVQGATISGDATLAAGGALTVTATNGTAFGALATMTPGTGVASALGVNVGSAGAFVTFNGALGTPSSGTLTNVTGLPISSGVSGLGTGIATALGVNVGTAGAPVINGGALGTPSSGTLTNATGLPISTGVSGLGTNVATNLAKAIGSEGAIGLSYGTVDANLQSGADVVAKITNATIQLNTDGYFGGTIDASGFTGNLTCTSSHNYMVLNWPVKNAAFPVTILWGTGVPQQSCFQVLPPGVQVVQRTPQQGPAFGANLFASASTLAAGSVAGAHTVTVTIASPAVVSDANTCTATGTFSGCVAPGSSVTFSTTGALPTGITAGTTYYVIAAGFTAGTSYEISTSQGGSAVVTSGTQNGTHTRTNTVNPNPAAYFVQAGTGSDSNVGTLQAPFLTLGHAQTAMRNASGNVTTTYIRSGTYSFSGTCTSSSSGLDLTSADAGTTWSYWPADGIGSAILDGGGGITSSNTGVYQIIYVDGTANNPSNITINGLQFQHGCTFNIAVAGTSGQNVQNTLIINNIFHDSYNIGVGLTSDGGTGNNTTNTVIAFNEFYNFGASAINSITSVNTLVNNGLTIANNATFNTCANATIGSDCGSLYIQNITATLSTGNYIGGNYVRDNGYSNGGAQSSQSKSLYLDNGQSNTWVIGNIVTGIVGNCFENNAGTANVFIFNVCDMGSNGSLATINGTPASPPLFTKNVFLPTNSTTFVNWAGGPTAATVTGNLYWSFQGTTPAVANDLLQITANPLFTDPVKYTFAANSPLNNAPFNFPPPSPYGPPGIALVQTGTPGTVPLAGTVGATNSAQLTPGPNFFDNGDFAIDQLFPTSLIASTSQTFQTSLTRILDRIYGIYTVSGSGGTAPAAARIAATSGMGSVPSELKVTTSASQTTSSTAGMITYVNEDIEGSTVAALNWGTTNAQPLTASLILKNSISASLVSVSVQGASSNQSLVFNCHTYLSATGTACKFVIPGPTTGTWTSNNQQNTIGLKFSIAVQCGSTFQAPDIGVWLVGTYYCSAGQTQQLGSANATLEISEIKLEPGVQPTPFVADPTQVALSKAQRFYESTFPLGTAPATNGGQAGSICTQTVSTTASTSGVTWTYKTEKVATPGTTQIYSTGSATNGFRDITDSSDLAGSVTAGSVGKTGLAAIATGAPSAAAKQICAHFSADSGGGNF